ncbi:MAG: VOC family protein [Phycisphaerales bacterium]
MSNVGPGVRPHLTVNGADAAIDFYVKALGAKEIHERVRADDGKRLLHGEMLIHGTVVYICDDFPEFCGGKSRDPKKLGGTPIRLHQCVPNCDEAVNRAAAAGATVVGPPSDMFWGDRYGVIEDPFGYEWSFSHPLAK